MKKALVILLCALAVFAIVSCKQEPKVETFKVTFDSQGGSEVAAATVEKGAKVAKPQDPSKLGVYFAGWFTDAECKESFDFDAAITKDITLYAKWKLDFKVNELTATKGVNDGLYSYDKFRIQFGDGSAVTFVKDDVLTIVYRSTRPIDNYSIRNDSKKWIYEQPKKAALPEGFLSEADEDGWITITFKFGEKSWDEGYTWNYESDTKKFYFDFIGTIIKDDVLEIKSVAKNGEPFAYTVLTSKYVSPAAKEIMVSASSYTGDVTYVVQYLDPLDKDGDGNPKGTAASVAENTLAPKPADLVKEGYVFGGWSTDKTGDPEKKWDFEKTVVESNTKLYAIWTATT